MLSLALILALPVSAWAIEILALESGSISEDGPAGAFSTLFSLEGQRLTLSLIGQTQMPAWGFRWCSSTSFVPGGPCQPGSVLPIGGFLGGSDVFGSATLDGVTNIVANNSAPSTDSLSLNVTGSYPVPPIAGVTGVVFTGPFSLSGFYTRGFGPPFALEGHGVYTLTLEVVHTQILGDLWQWRNVEFDLQPIPEPATLLLWGTGAAGLGVARWVKRRRAA
jgi:hypothetical protein